MSFAVIKTGGKQYKVQAGEIIKIERLEDSKPETKLQFNEVLAYGDDKNLELGEPTISGAKVEADLIKNGKNRTVLIFKKRRRKNSRRKNGHRQQFSLIRINKIFAKDGKIISEAEIKKEASKEIKTQTKEVSNK
jgi:large subunit ribosomal protein L21